MAIPATANLTWAITNGSDDCNAILVAVDADAHKKAKSIPAIIHLYSFLMLAGFNFIKVIESWGEYHLCIRQIFLRAKIWQQFNTRFVYKKNFPHYKGSL